MEEIKNEALTATPAYQAINAAKNNEEPVEGGIQLIDLWYILIRFFFRILILTVIVMAVEGVVTSKLIKTKYSAKASLILNPGLYYLGELETPTSQLSGNRVAVQYGKELLPSVVKYAKTNNELKKAVYEASKENGSKVESLGSGSLSFETADDELQVFVTYTTTTSPEVAKATVNKFVDELVEKSNAKNSEGNYIYPWAQTINIDGYAEGYSRSNSWLTYFLLTGVAAFVLFYAYYLLMTLIDDTVKSKREVELLTGYNVMAYIEDIDLEKIEKSKARRAKAKAAAGGSKAE